MKNKLRKAVRITRIALDILLLIAGLALGSFFGWLVFKIVKSFDL